MFTSHWNDSHDKPPFSDRGKENSGKSNHRDKDYVDNNTAFLPLGFLAICGIYFRYKFLIYFYFQRI